MNKLAGKSIPLYNLPPSGNIHVETLESLINIRHEILHAIESKNPNEQTSRYTYIKTLLQKNEPKIGWETQTESDIISHFILSLAFCKNDQDRLWFSNMESKLFMIRCELYSVDLDEIFFLLSIPLEKIENVSSEMDGKDNV